MTKQEITEKILDTFEKAAESPRKYLRLVLAKEKCALVFNGEMHPINKCTLFYRNCDNQHVQQITSPEFIEGNDFLMVLVLRPKKHMAVSLLLDEKRTEKYFRLDEEKPANDDYFICMLEAQRETFLLAYLKGTYFLRTFDEEFQLTLYDLLQFLLSPPLQIPEKEVDNHGEEA